LILVDFNQVAISNMYQNLKDIKEGDSINPDFLKHMILNSLRGWSKKYRKQYGDVVIACDSTSWRHDYFPYYKFHRSEGRKHDDVDWEYVYGILNNLLTEMDTYFPYKVIRVNGAEADDVIGTLVKECYMEEPIIVISSDKDFVQLQKYPNVRQYSPMHKEEVVETQPLNALKEHIIRGQKKDSIPNFLSSDRAFVDGERQKPIFQKKLDRWMEMNIDEIVAEEGQHAKSGWDRNRKLIDLDYVPEYIHDSIMQQFDTPVKADRMSIVNYLQTKGYNNLLKNVEDF